MQKILNNCSEQAIDFRFMHHAEVKVTNYMALSNFKLSSRIREDECEVAMHNIAKHKILNLHLGDSAYDA